MYNEEMCAGGRKKEGAGRGGWGVITLISINISEQQSLINDCFRVIKVAVLFFVTNRVCRIDEPLSRYRMEYRAYGTGEVVTCGAIVLVIVVCSTPLSAFVFLTVAIN